MRPTIETLRRSFGSDITEPGAEQDAVKCRYDSANLLACNHNVRPQPLVHA